MMLLVFLLGLVLSVGGGFFLWSQREETETPGAGLPFSPEPFRREEEQSWAALVARIGQLENLVKNLQEEVPLNLAEGNQVDAEFSISLNDNFQWAYDRATVRHHRFEEIYQAYDSGKDVEQISRETKRGKGEIELILRLRR